MKGCWKCGAVCEPCGKVVYCGKRHAKAQARRTETNGSGAKKGQIESYRCTAGDGWHIGHPAGEWRPREQAS